MKTSEILFIFEVFAFVGSGVLLGVGGYIRFGLIFTLAMTLAVITGKQIAKETREQVMKENNL